MVLVTAGAALAFYKFIIGITHSGINGCCKTFGDLTIQVCTKAVTFYTGTKGNTILFIIVCC